MKIVKTAAGIFLLAGLLTLNSCNQESEKIDNHPATEKTLPAPFHYQKSIEVRPGLIMDVLSWGRGADSTGSYLILRSDSTHAKFGSTSGDLEGSITDVWNMDMDSDGKPEIFIQTKDKKSYLNLYVHEFDDSGSSQKLRFPELTDATKKKYRGMDSVYIKDGKLMREFPLFSDSDPNDKHATGKKIVEYDLSGNNFSIKEVKGDESESQKVGK